MQRRTSDLGEHLSRTGWDVVNYRGVVIYVFVEVRLNSAKIREGDSHDLLFNKPVL